MKTKPASEIIPGDVIILIDGATTVTVLDVTDNPDLAPFSRCIWWLRDGAIKAHMFYANGEEIKVVET